MSEEIRILKRDFTWLQDRHEVYEEIKERFDIKYFMESAGDGQARAPVSLMPMVLSYRLRLNESEHRASFCLHPGQK